MIGERSVGMSSCSSGLCDVEQMDGQEPVPTEAPPAVTKGLQDRGIDTRLVGSFRMGARAVDWARLESVCTERYRGFESRPIRLFTKLLRTKDPGNALELF